MGRLGVEFASATLNATSESLRISWSLSAGKSKSIRSRAATRATCFSNGAIRSGSIAGEKEDWVDETRAKRAGMPSD
jgi:hypothetical protein